MVVVLTHLCEALHLFSWVGWGRPHSVGHYVDFWSAVLGLTLFPVGYFLDALTRRVAGGEAVGQIRRAKGGKMI